MKSEPDKLNLRRREERWAIEWRSCNRLNGAQSYLIGKGNGEALTFRSRREARQCVKEKYGFIEHSDRTFKARPDKPFEKVENRDG